MTMGKSLRKTISEMFVVKYIIKLSEIKKKWSIPGDKIQNVKN